jgi:hypothetical protein
MEAPAPIDSGDLQRMLEAFVNIPLRIEHQGHPVPLAFAYQKDKHDRPYLLFVPQIPCTGI